MIPHGGGVAGRKGCACEPCKARKAEYNAAWYQRNQASQRATARARAAGRVAVNSAMVQKLKESSPCADCGSFYPYYVMQYDHTGTDKVASVSRLYGGGMDRLLAEIAKCELVCANCHAVRTHTRYLEKCGIIKI